MKRTYIKPAVEVVDLETMATCIQPQSWNVDGGKNPDDHGYIIEDRVKVTTATTTRGIQTNGNL